jgi:hypothetical protein
MKFSMRQCYTTIWVGLGVGLFGFDITDKQPYGIYLGVVLVVAAAATILYVRFNTEEPPVEEEDEEEPLERESPYYLTVGELISILEDSVDDSVVVLDGLGHPISNVTENSDPDFTTGVWLSGYAVNRNLYQLDELTKKSEKGADEV